MSQPASLTTEQHLAGHLGEETAEYEIMQALLADEQRALITGNPQEVELLATSKLRQLERIDVLGRTRADLMHQLGLNDRTALYGWLASRPDMLSAWQRLELVSEKARAANSTNGKLIAERLTHVNQAISTLMSSDQSTLGYERDGSARSAISGGRSFGAA